MHRFEGLVLLIVVGLCGSAWCDQVTLKNGDRLSGNIVKSDGKTLVLHTDAAGDVTIQWPAIDTIQTTQSLHVGLSSGTSLVGPVTTSEGSLVVATATNGPVTEPKAAVTSLRNDAEEKAYEKLLHPSLTQGWAGGVNVGFGLTRGNSATKNLSIAFTSLRKTTHDEISLYTTSLYAANDAAGAFPSTTANSIQGGGRYNRNVGPRFFGYGSGDFQADALQGLNLRSVLGAGLGLHAIKSDRTILELLGGANYTRESYARSLQSAGPPAIFKSAFTRDSAGASVGEELAHKWGKATLLTQKLYFYPDLTDTGEYRGAFNFGAVTKINKWLGWQTAFGDIYVSNPPNGKRKNDIVFTTGLNISFSH